MGLLENISGLAGNASKNFGDSKFITGLLQVIENKFGGLGSFIQTLNQSGLGDIVSSWIGTGANKSISEGEVVRGFGKENIHELSEKTGMPESDTVKKLTTTLPEVVNKLTPEGVLPRGNIMDMATKLFSGEK
jgi:uncharacterized protein YidB (DUF937 family)